MSSSKSSRRWPSRCMRCASRAVYSSAVAFHIPVASLLITCRDTVHSQLSQDAYQSAIQADLHAEGPSTELVVCDAEADDPCTAAGAVMPAGSHLSTHIHKIIQEWLHSLQAVCAL